MQFHAISLKAEYTYYMKNFLNERGQTSVEYILMIVTVAIVATSTFKLIEEHLLTGPNSFKNRYLGQYKNMFEAGSVNLQYKYFTLKR